MENKNLPPLKFVIENSEFETTNQYKTGKELKELANIPLDTDLYLSVTRPYQDELIENDKEVNLARPETEYFYVRKKLEFFINGQPFTWYKKFIKGYEVRELGNIPESEALYLKADEGWEDREIADDEKVDISRAGKEQFLSKFRKVTIIVNGRDKVWDKATISFEEVVALKGTNGDGQVKAYTVTYYDGPKANPQGELVAGETVFVKNKMNFNVTATNRS